MSQNQISEKFAGRYDVLALVAGSLILFTVAVFLPATTLTGLAEDRTFSVVSSVGALYSSGKGVLGTVVLLFSIVFPLIKFCALLYVWWGGLSERNSIRAMGWLKLLGKWSMLDVYVIAITTCTIQLGILGETIPRIGIYLFMVAILLSAVAISWMAALCLEAVDQDDSERVRIPDGPLLPLLIVAAVGLLVGGILLPVMKVEKLVFWENQYSVLGGIQALFSAERYGLAGALTLFVVVFPLSKLATVFWIWAIRRSDTRRRVQSWLLKLDEWSMMEVFSLALLVVITKITDTVDLEPQLGLWCLMAAATLMAVISFLIHRSSHEEGA